jgi:hypothetical protein
MAIIRKKITPAYFADVESGKKNFEFRLADFAVAEGDTLILQEWDPAGKSYTGREICKKVSYVGKFSLDSFGQREQLEKDGFYILSLE